MWKYLALSLQKNECYVLPCSLRVDIVIWKKYLLKGWICDNIFKDFLAFSFFFMDENRKIILFLLTMRFFPFSDEKFLKPEFIFHSRWYRKSLSNQLYF